MGHFGCPGGPGTKVGKRVKFSSRMSGSKSGPPSDSYCSGLSHFLVHGFWGSSRISSVKRRAMNISHPRARVQFGLKGVGVGLGGWGFINREI